MKNLNTKDPVVSFLAFWTNNYFENLSSNEVFKIIKDFTDANDVSINKLFEYINASRSGYYNWLSKGAKLRKDNSELDKIVKELFFEANEVYGRPRLTMLIKEKYGWVLDEKTVGASMARQGLKAKVRVKRFREIKNTGFSVTDHIKQHFRSNIPFEKLYTDVSQINTTTTPIFISAVIDGFNDEIIDFRLSADRDPSFVYENVEKALSLSNIKSIIHSDHGFEYTSNQYLKIIEKYNAIHSMGRQGVSLDNRPIEYFFSILKQECVFRIPEKERTIKNLEEKIYEFISWYNKDRISTNLGKSPLKYKFSKDM